MSLDYKNLYYDAVIIGGGTSGVIAAIEAARRLDKVLLVEKNGFLGGTSYSSLVIPFFTFHDKAGNKIVSGLPEELIERLKKDKASYGHIRDTIGVAYSYTPYDENFYQIHITEMLKEANCDVMFNSVVLEGEKKADYLKSIKVFTKTSYYKIFAKYFIDATGDSDIAYFLNLPLIYEKELQPQTLIFKLSNINYEEIIKYMLENKQDFHYETLFDLIEQLPFFGVSGFFSYAKYIKDNVLRDRFLFFVDKNKREAIVNTTRILTDTKDLWTKFEYRQKALQQVYFLYKFMKERLPGFKNSYISQIAPYIGIRESRKIKGIYVLKDKDILEGKEFKDSIARGGFAIDIHKRDFGILSKNLKKSYTIPYFSMLVENLNNVIFTGRNISAQKQAYASLRVSATAMALGQVSGISVFLALKEKKLLQELNMDKLHQLLDKAGVIY